MIYCNIGRTNGKKFILCNRVVELEHEIEILKRLNLSYKHQEQELNEIYKVIDGGKNETNTKKQTSKRRLL